jgi:hypothetical protein
LLIIFVSNNQIKSVSGTGIKWRNFYLAVSRQIQLVNANSLFFVK